MKKTLLTLILALTSILGFSQTTEVHHDPDNCKFTIVTTSATYEASIANPSTTGNAATLVSKFTPAANNVGVTVPLGKSYLEGDNFSVEMLVNTFDDDAGKMILRLYNSSQGTGPDHREQIGSLNYLDTNEWQTFSFTDVTIGAQSAAVVTAGGYDTALFIINNGNTVDSDPVYIDDLKFFPSDPTATLGTDNQWYYDDGVVPSVTPVAFSTLHALDNAAATPSTTGNSNATVVKATKSNSDATSGVDFIGLNTESTGTNTITLRVYPVCNDDVVTPSVRIRLRSGNSSTNQILSLFHNLIYNKWNEVSYDFSADEVTDGTIYDRIQILLNQGDSSTLTTEAVFYIDALQAPITEAVLSTNNIDSQEVGINVYPNPVTGAFTLNSNTNIESVQVYAINGSLLKTFSPATSYDISDLAAGIYFVSTGSKTVKIVKK